MKDLLKVLLPLFICAASYAQDSLTQKFIGKQFLQLLIEEKYEQAVLLFSPQTAIKLNAVNLESSWKTVQNQTGKFKTPLGIKTKYFPDFNIVIATCEFEYARLDLKALFDEKNKISSIHFLPTIYKLQEETEYRLPDYIKKRKVREKEIYFKTDVFLLPGVLTVRKRRKNLPLVILVHDSGPFDKDATLGSSKIFKDLAWGLAAKGVAVIRYDKRTFVYNAKMKERYGDKITVMEETVSDVITAINLARTMPGINHQRIFVAGHGLGGMVAPRIASMKPGLAGIIVMAGYARPFEDIILEQVRNSESKGPGNRLERIEQQVATVKSPYLTTETPASELPLNHSSSYWIDINNYNQIAAAKNAKVPMLFLQGQQDDRLFNTDFTIWKKELGSIGLAYFKSYPDLNHFFIGDVDPDNMGENSTGNIPEYVITDIATWIKKR